MYRVSPTHSCSQLYLPLLKYVPSSDVSARWVGACTSPGPVVEWTFQGQWGYFPPLWCFHQHPQMIPLVSHSSFLAAWYLWSQHDVIIGPAPCVALNFCLCSLPTIASCICSEWPLVCVVPHTNELGNMWKLLASLNVIFCQCISANGSLSVRVAFVATTVCVLVWGQFAETLPSSQYL